MQRAWTDLHKGVRLLPEIEAGQSGATHIWYYKS